MNKSEQLVRAKEFFSYALIFLLATIIRVSFNFLSPHPNSAFGQDAAEYLRDAQGLAKAFSLSPGFWVDALTTAFGDPANPNMQVMHDSLSSLKELSTGGPVFPFFILIATAIFGQTVSYEHYVGPVLAYSLLSAATCVLIGLTTKHCWSRRAGVIAGVLAALYPGFIVNSGRLYSESFAAFLLSLIAFLFCKAIVTGYQSTRQSLLMGFVAASLQVTRSVMAALSVLLLPLLALINPEQFKRTLLLFVLGMAMLLLPWFALQKCVLGKSSFVVDRYSHFNLFLGTNVDTLGFLTFPYPDLTGIEQEPFPTILANAWQKSPERFLKLSLDKVPRLYKFPWNDFKASIGPFDFFSQVLFHQILFGLAALGLVIALFIDLDKGARVRLLLARLFILLLFAFDFIYLPFIAVPRYALCAMPFMIMFAAAGLTVAARCVGTIAGTRSLIRLSIAFLVFLTIERANVFDLLARLIKNFFVPLLFIQILLKLLAVIALTYAALQMAKYLKLRKELSGAAAAFCLLLALPSLCLPLRAHGRWYEWKDDLSDRHGGYAHTIAISADNLKELIARPGFLAVNVGDGSQFASDFQVTVCGNRLHGPYIPAMSLATGLNNLKALPNDSITPEVDYILSDLSSFTDMSNAQLRQWYLIPIPPELMQAYGKKWADSSRFIKTMQQMASLDPRRIVDTNVTKSPELITTLAKVTNHPNACYGIFETNDQYALLPSVDKYSWEKGFFAVENDHGVGDLELDTKLTLSAEAKAFAKSKGYSRMRPDIRILISPPPPLSTNPDQARFAKHPAEILQTIDAPDMPLVTGSDNIRNIPVSDLPIPNSEAIWLVRCRAWLAQVPAPRTFDFTVATIFGEGDKKVTIYPSAWVPHTIKSSEKQTLVDYVFPLSPAALPGKLKSISLSVKPHGDEQSARQRTVQSELMKIKFDIYQLPTNPIAAGHEIL